MDFLYFLEDLRNPVLDAFFQTVTHLGSETLFLVAALVLFWCVDKRQGYYLLAVGFLGTVVNQFLKLWYRVPRPWVRDPGFTIVESAREGATGYSFPSGHSQTAVGSFGVLALCAKRNWLRGVWIACAVLVPFSRMYLGVHTPADVLAGSACALVLVLVLRPVVFSQKKWAFPALLAVMIGCGLGFLLFAEYGPFPGDMDRENLAHGVKNAYTLLGALLGFLLAYLADERKLHFPVKAVWWAQILKVFLGLGVTVVLKSVLKAPLMAAFGGHYGADCVRYCLVVIFAALVWPSTFRWFSALGGKK